MTHGPYGGGSECVETIGSDIFAGAGRGIYKSTDNGSTWTKVSPDGVILWISDIVEAEGVIYAGTANNQGIYASTDGGSTWNKKNNGLTSFIIQAMHANEDGVFAETHNGTFF
ncbi:MAG TPA: sialidase family protein, partial [Chitinophagaceae bacterium]|nr:sialidase family protein [Chitinophagaceae bacterium]